MKSDARVILWGSVIGGVSWLYDRQTAVFQYDPEFARSGIQVSPLTMPLREYPYQFPELARNTFHGLPGLLADSLPDKFGNAVINAWLAGQGRSPESFNPVERLCYTGRRGMGALEFEPVLFDSISKTGPIDVAGLVELSNRVLDQRAGLRGVLHGEDDRDALGDILRVGTSAGGARAKAVLGWNPQTGDFRSGQLACPPGFEYWIMKFDGVGNNRDKEISDPLGYGKIEYAYSLMAAEAGIVMMPCRLHHEGGRSHFMTKRFDRSDSGMKIHMQSLAAIVHTDFNMPGGYSYEEALVTMKRMGLLPTDCEQQVLRTFFNVVSRNQDDHVKNIAFLMDKKGEWRLSPAFDVTYAFNPQGDWTGRHQMTINGKQDLFTRDDLYSLAQVVGIKRRKADEMLERVISAVTRWPEMAEVAGVPEELMVGVRMGHRLVIPD